MTKQKGRQQIFEELYHETPKHTINDMRYIGNERRENTPNFDDPDFFETWSSLRWMAVYF